MAHTGRYRKSVPEISDVETTELHLNVHKGEGRVMGMDAPCCAGASGARKHVSPETTVLDPVWLQRRFVPECEL